MPTPALACFYSATPAWNPTAVDKGASMVRIDRHAGKDALVLDWRMEWMMVGPRAEIVSGRDLHDSSEQLGFGFGNEMMRAA